MARWPRARFGTYQTPFVTVLKRAFSDDALGEAVAVLVKGEVGFFDERADEAAKAEIARFFARCEPYCREPVVAPQFALQMMASWTGRQLHVGGERAAAPAFIGAPDWSHALRDWIFRGHWSRTGVANIPVTARQRAALERALRLLTGYPFQVGEHVRALTIGWGPNHERRGVIDAISHESPSGALYELRLPSGLIRSAWDNEMERFE